MPRQRYFWTNKFFVSSRFSNFKQITHFVMLLRTAMQIDIKKDIATHVSTNSWTLQWFCLNLWMKIISSHRHREPEMKRTICKQCGLILKPGISAELSIANEKNEHRNECVIQCGKCNTRKRFNINPKYNLWIDTEQAINETICPGNQSNVPAKQQ